MIKSELEHDADRIVVTFTGELGRVDGWAPAREDLGLNTGGPDPVDGLEVIEEVPEYYDDAEEHVAGYSEVVLGFDDADALEVVSDRLYEKATERFEWGIHKEAEQVQTFAGAIPSAYDARRAEA